MAKGNAKAAPAARKLTPKQEAFCLAYIETGNASEAYRRSGVSEENIGSGFYVYFLIDPTNQQIFYIGKGKNNRVRQHAVAARKGRIDNAEKHKRIIAIQEQGGDVIESIFCNCENESQAFIIEREMIEKLAAHGLTNIKGGIYTNEELAKERVKSLLKRILPYDVWVNTASEMQIQAAARTSGSPKAFYDEYVGNVKRLCGILGVKSEGAISYDG
ncbi:LEM-3-like GIY-YIG domain-containing protein [Oligella urethralis]|uniref:LEM-3-like GIY-YIG domain-containing protein n=1 Tax=Oligella urethralis TaxID=90245 RepID=UPI00288A5581|nr:terminase small subunit [Oligella urethralis]